ncbi:MAG: hypothetical protein M3O62_13595 [Pseudomonadota bacterium]|nr:hypothetical protein [Pseudomonadota bacterium]
MNCRPVPAGRWVIVCAIAFALFSVFVLALEFALAYRGIDTTVADTVDRWLTQRARANRLGSQALALVGASRIQLGVDLSELDALTGMKAVQLAIDGSSFVPVLRNLAEDEGFTGSVIVSYNPEVLINPRDADAASDYVSEWTKSGESMAAELPVTYSVVERRLETWLHSSLRSYADDGGPMVAIEKRILGKTPTRQYLTTLPSRERSADYQLVSIPEVYQMRVLETMGIDYKNYDLDAPPDEVEARLAALVDNLTASGSQQFAGELEGVERMARQIEDRGGRVYFFVFPTSGLIRKIEERRFPRAQYWDEFAARAPEVRQHSDGVPDMQNLSCPDGSHLDYRDKQRFTSALAKTLGLVRQ